MPRTCSPPKRSAPATAASPAKRPCSSLPAQSSRVSLKVLAWNVNGLRALWRFGNASGAPLKELVQAERPHVLFLSETKIDEKGLASLDGATMPTGSKDIRSFFGGAAAKKAACAPRDLLQGYRAVWNHSRRKTGYAGTVVFLKRGVPLLDAATVQRDGLVLQEAEAGEEGTGDAAARLNGEGRLLTVDLGPCFLVHTYVPNSGRKLEKVGYRTRIWDPAMRAHLRRLDAEKPVMWLGDLNVVHGEVDIYDELRATRNRRAGCADAERESFGRIVRGVPGTELPSSLKGLAQRVPGGPDAPMVDAFRLVQPYAMPGAELKDAELQEPLEDTEGDLGSAETGPGPDSGREREAGAAAQETGPSLDGDAAEDAADPTLATTAAARDADVASNRQRALEDAPFTYWNETDARNPRRGWRLDYCIVSAQLGESADVAAAKRKRGVGPNTSRGTPRQTAPAHSEMGGAVHGEAGEVVTTIAGNNGGVVIRDAFHRPAVYGSDHVPIGIVFDVLEGTN